MNPLFIVTITLIAVAFSLAAEGKVKLSKSGICHDEASPWYQRTRAVKTFDTVEACLQVDGARLPKLSSGA